MLKGKSTFYTRQSPFIFSVWDYVPVEFKITCDVALHGASDAIAMMEMPRSCEPEST